MTTHTRKYGSERLTIECDMTQASAPIRMTWDGPEYDGRFVTAITPFQTASARHSLNEAFRLCRNWGG